MSVSPAPLNVVRVASAIPEAAMTCLFHVRHVAAHK